jgi:hypothetical protein
MGKVRHSSIGRKVSESSGGGQKRSSGSAQETPDAGQVNLVFPTKRAATGRQSGEMPCGNRNANPNREGENYEGPGWMLRAISSGFQNSNQKAEELPSPPTDIVF